MAIKTLRTRVRDGFAELAGTEFAERYLEHLLSNLREIETAARRSAALLVVAVVAFFLLGGTDVTVDLGPVTLSNTAAVVATLPAIVSFLSYELVVLLGAGQRFVGVFRTLVQLQYPSIYDNDLECLLIPTTVSLWGDHPWRSIRAMTETRASLVLQAASVVTATGLLLGGVAFQVYAYAHLLHHRHVAVAVVVACIVFSVFNVMRTVLMFFDEALAIGPRPDQEQALDEAASRDRDAAAADAVAATDR